MLEEEFLTRGNNQSVACVFVFLVSRVLMLFSVSLWVCLGVCLCSFPLCWFESSTLCVCVGVVSFSYFGSVSKKALHILLFYHFVVIILDLLCDVLRFVLLLLLLLPLLLLPLLPLPLPPFLLRAKGSNAVVYVSSKLPLSLLLSDCSPPLKINGVGPSFPCFSLFFFLGWPFCWC